MAEQYANVTVSYKMHGDRRFDLLAQLAGWSRPEACWRMVELWARCTALQTDRPPAAEIRIHLGPRGEELLVEAVLAERAPDGSLRMLGGGLTGGDTDRFGWYEPTRTQNVAAGRARAAGAVRGQRGRFAPGSTSATSGSTSAPPAPPADRPAHTSTAVTSGDPAVPPAATSGSTSDPPAATSGSPAVTSGSPASGFRIPNPEEDLSLPRVIRPSTEPTAAPPPILPGSIARAAARRRLITAAWQLGGDAFRELGRDGIEPTAPDAWAGIPSAESVPMQRLIAIVDDLLVGDVPDVHAATAVIKRRIAVAVAEGRAASPPTRRWLTPMRIWDAESFAKGAELSPEQVRPRAPPMAGQRGRADPQPAPPRKPDPGPPPVTVSDADRAEAAEACAELLKTLSTYSTTTDDKPQRKAAK